VTTFLPFLINFEVGNPFVHLIYGYFLNLIDEAAKPIRQGNEIIPERIGP
jgi:hypothetical protein